MPGRGFGPPPGALLLLCGTDAPVQRRRLLSLPDTGLFFTDTGPYLPDTGTFTFTFYDSSPTTFGTDTAFLSDFEVWRY